MCQKNINQCDSLKQQSNLTAEEAEIDVLWEDQQKINTFGRLNIRREELEDEIAELKEEINKINDAADEIIISDDVKFSIGEIYVDVDGDTAEALLEKERKRVNKSVKALEVEYQQIQDKMKILKAQLYAKFKNNINLDPK